MSSMLPSSRATIASATRETDSNQPGRRWAQFRAGSKQTTWGRAALSGARSPAPSSDGTSDARGRQRGNGPGEMGWRFS